MGSRADLEVAIRPGNRELPEEEIRHPIVVVLAGMEKELLMARAKDL
jgi:hypothetical protein